jgi:hypothetical protein
MNGEVQLIVKVPGTKPSGTILATESGVIDTNTTPQSVFSYPNDMSAYVGGYVQMQSALYGDLGTFYISAVTLDNPAYAFISPTNTQLFSTAPWNFANTDLPNFNYMQAVPAIVDMYLDLFENESISQNWKFQDLNNFTAQGAFSREFRVPFSDNNQKALGSLFDVNTDAGANNYFHYKLPAEIRVDTLPIATGYIRVRKIYKQMNRIHEVELAFYAETPDLVRNIGDKKLVDIADLTTLDEVVSYDLVTTPTSERIWTLCDRGQRWSEGGEANTRSLVTASTPVFAEDLTPALSWWYLFEKIITDAGFELVAGTLNSLLSNYWMPWCNQSSLIGSDSFNSLFFRAYNSAQVGIGNTFTAIPINTELFDNNGNFNTATYTYTAPGGGWYTFRAVLKFSTVFTANPWNIIVALEVNGLTNFNEMFTGSVTNNSIVDCDLRIALNTGDVVRLVVLQSNLAVNNQLYVQAGDGTFNKTLFEINKTELFFGQTIYYNLNAPDMKQIDFVTDVIKMHNCAIVPDRANPTKIYIVPQNSYLGSGTTLDWTSKLDTSKDVVIGSTVDLQKSKFQFTYAAGDDIISKQYQVANRIYGDYEAVGYTINPNTTPSDFAIGDQKIQLVTRSTPSGLVKGSGYVIPIFLNDQLEFVAPGARCLYEAGTYDVQLYDDGISAAVNTSVPVLNNYSVLVPELDDYDLNWAPEVPAQPILSNPYNNLFNLYWRTYMNALYSPEARMMEANFALDLKDILTFSFADKIWIQDSYWRIVEISDYKVGMYESTKVKLLKFLEDVEDCASTPVSVSINGEVNFEDGNGDPVAATQDCCSRYGYNWDEVNAVCWAFTPTGDRPNSGVNGNATNPAPRVIKAAAQTRSIVNSVITGETIEIAIGNKDMLAAGQHLTLTKDVQGSTLLGKNVSTNLPGIHIGGGYRDGVVGGTSPAWAQFGFFVLQKRPTIITSGDVVDLDIEGVPGEYINIDNDNVWSCILNVLIRDTTGASETSIHHFTFDKIGGVANASAITTLNTIGAIGTNVFTFGIDTATNPDEHRINVTVTGGTYPEQFSMNATLQYQQSKYT